MKKITIKMSLTAVTALMISGCSFTSDALFPSLLGSDSQEEMAASGNYTASADSSLPALGSTNFEPLEISQGSNTGTFVGQKVVAFRNELSQLQSAIKVHNEELQKIRTSVINNAMQYHKTVGNIEAKLQVGTTPGNPQMFAMLQGAQNNIQVMNANTIALNRLSARATSDAAMTSYLLDSIRAAYGVSGAVDEDHRQLRILENETNQTSILINSLLNEVNSDIRRQQQYVETAKNNIVDLNEAIKVGSYGVSNVPLSGMSSSPRSFGVASSSAVASGKPLFVAKFNKSKVNYKDGLRRAVTQAQSAKPNVRFEVVAVSPVSGSQLSKSNAQSNAGMVFKDMISMGVGADRISLSAKTSGDVKSAEVQIFVR